MLIGNTSETLILVVVLTFSMTGVVKTVPAADRSDVNTVSDDETDPGSKTFRLNSEDYCSGSTAIVICATKCHEHFVSAVMGVECKQETSNNHDSESDEENVNSLNRKKRAVNMFCYCTLDCTRTENTCRIAQETYETEDDELSSTATSKTTTCNLNEWKCENGNCILERFVCDNDDDCGDSSDETNCKVPVGPHIRRDCDIQEFSCHDDPTICIPKVWACDGERDCQDLSDETDCTINQCIVSAWSEPTECSVSCGGGEMTRTRTVVKQPESSEGCPSLIQVEDCKSQSCDDSLSLLVL